MGFFDSEGASAEDMVTDADMAEEVLAEEGQPAVADATDVAPDATSAEDPGHEPQALEGDIEAPTSVPLQELLNERRKRQDIEAEMQEHRQSNAVLNERVRNLWESQQQTRQAQQQEKQPAEEVPDPEEDPLGHANWRIKKMEDQLRQVATNNQRGMQQQAAAQRQQAQQNETQSIVSQSQNMQTQFANEHGDYWDAYKYLEDTRTAELQSMGYDEKAVTEVISNERSMIVSQSIERDPQGRPTGWRQNPAEVAYNLAKMRGYAPPAPVETAPQQVDVPTAQRMDMAANGQATGNSVGAIGRSTTPGGAPTLESVANMSDVEFERFSRENPGIVETLLSSG